MTASRMCIQPVWIRDQAMKGRKGIYDPGSELTAIPVKPR